MRPCGGEANVNLGGVVNIPGDRVIVSSPSLVTVTTAGDGDVTLAHSPFARGT